MILIQTIANLLEKFAYFSFSCDDFSLSEEYAVAVIILVEFHIVLNAQRFESCMLFIFRQYYC